MGRLSDRCCPDALWAVSALLVLLLAGCGNQSKGGGPTAETLAPQMHGPALPGSAAVARPFRTSQATLNEDIARVHPTGVYQGADRNALLQQIKLAYATDRRELILEYLEATATLPHEEQRRALRQLEIATKAKR